MARPFATLLALPVCALACSRVVFNRGGDDLPVITARTMDWDFKFDDFLLVNPRGQRMDGGLGNASSSKVWTSKYGSVVASVNGWLRDKVSSQTGEACDFQRDGASDGINEAGLAVHLLNLDATVYNKTFSGPVGVTYMRWVRFLLDTCGTVQEAVDAMKTIEIADMEVSTTTGESLGSFGLHVAVEDASGDSAIFEIINGTTTTYHGRSAEYMVMTNDPPFDQQLANLKRYEAFGGERHLPGGILPDERFVRASYYLRHVPELPEADAMVGYMKTVVRDVAVPFGAPYLPGDPLKATYPTWWTSLIDLENQVYHWGWTLNPNIIRVDLRALADQQRLEEGAPTLVLNPRRATLVGDVTAEFRPLLRRV